MLNQEGQVVTMRTQKSFYVESLKIYDNCVGRKILKPSLEYKFVSLSESDADFFGENIMVSAIVGMNGSGKTSLLDTMFRMINNLGVFISLKTDRPSAESLYYVKGVYADLRFTLDQQSCCLHCRGDALALDIGDKEHFRFGNDDGEFNGPEYKPFNGQGKGLLKSIMNSFFYTIVSNYSFQAYNSADYTETTCVVEQSGKVSSYPGEIWINSIFNKNDAYFVPINFNPYRDNGIVDTNNVANLAHSRICAILIYFQRAKADGRQFIDGYELHEIKYKFNESSPKEKFYREYRKTNRESNVSAEDLFNKFCSHLQDKNSVLYHILDAFNVYSETDDDRLKYGYFYLVYKVFAVASRYSAYNRYEEYFGNLKNLWESCNEQRDREAKELASGIMSDQSHITLKIRQTVRYFRIFQELLKKGEILRSEFDHNYYLSVLPEHENISVQYIMEILPPPFFDSEVILQRESDNSSQGDKMSLEALSTGERQFYYVTSGVVYHIMNIRSIPYNRPRYRNILLVLDETELSFHPEYQRTFLNNLIGLIKRLGLNRNMAIHILFTTHSPFMLSDVPKENILYVKDGYPMDGANFVNPFGANVNDILLQSFFLQNGFIGEFAKKKILSLVQYLSDEPTDGDEQWDKEKALRTINKIGEPMIRRRLQKMYGEKHDDWEPEIKELENRLEELKKKQENEKNFDNA